MSEYIGARISLISKSDIKYIGTLKSIDSDSATVSLADVQCLGTEGRKGDPAQEIPGSEVIYEGIVFRGSDVKDLNILTSPGNARPQEMPNDPAILESSQTAPAQPKAPAQVPPQSQQGPSSQNQFQNSPAPYPQQQQQQQRPQYPQFGFHGPPPPGQFQGPRFQGPGGAHGFPGTPGAVPGYSMGYGGPPPGYNMGMGYGPPPPGPGFNQPPPPPGHFPPQMPIGPPGQQMNQQRPPPQQMSAGQPAPVGSNQKTPAPNGAQAPSAPPVSNQQKPVEMSTTPAPASAPAPPIASKPSTAAALAPSGPGTAQQSSNARAPPKTNNRVAVPLTTNPALAKQQPKAAAPTQQQAPQTSSQPQSVPAGTDAATAAVAAAMAKLGIASQQRGEAPMQTRVHDGQSRGRGRGRGGPPRGGRSDSAPKTVEVPKEDYDFASANAKFNKKEVVKEAIASGSPVTSPVNGATPDPLATKANGHGDAEDVVIPAKPTAERGYDKKSSFFDNISSDLKERFEQQAADQPIDGRAMRREERSKNMETFGQGSIDGGFRGRGRGRGRGFGRGRRSHYGGGSRGIGPDGRARGRGGAANAAPAA